MKKLFFSAMLCLLTLSLNAQEFVDLGLPSGTLWKNQNEPSLYTVDEGVSAFGEALPTDVLWYELKVYCKWTWRSDNSGYIVEGPNGNSIFLPRKSNYKDCNGSVAQSYDGSYYLTSSIYYNTSYYYFQFTNLDTYMRALSGCTGAAVRLVQFPRGGKYVDLGLPSGTLWKETIEPKLYTFQQINETLKDKLPTKAQWKELIDKCQWNWKENGYEVVGPNGASIFLPLMGLRRGQGDQLWGYGMDGFYLSSTMKDSYFRCGVYLGEGTVQLDDTYMANQGRGPVEYTVILVK